MFCYFIYIFTYLFILYSSVYFWGCAYRGKKAVLCKEEIITIQKGRDVFVQDNRFTSLFWRRKIYYFFRIVAHYLISDPRPGCFIILLFCFFFLAAYGYSRNSLAGLIKNSMCRSVFKTVIPTQNAVHCLRGQCWTVLIVKIK